MFAGAEYQCSGRVRAWKKFFHNFTHSDNYAYGVVTALLRISKMPCRQEDPRGLSVVS